MARTDVLIVSLGSTGGLREADAELAASLARAGARVRVVRAGRPVEPRTFALVDLAWALSARRAAVAGVARYAPRSVIYSSVTAALLAPVPGAVRFDAPAAGNRPGRHGALWQRPRERAVLRRAPLLLPWSDGGLAEAPAGGARALVVPMPVEPSGGAGGLRDIAAVTYGANPEKKGLDRVLAAWAACGCGEGEGGELLIAGLDDAGWRRGAARLGISPDLPPGARLLGPLPRDDYRALLRRARAFVTAPRREDYGIAQLEALADGAQLVTTPAPGPYAALPVARGLDPRLVSDDLASALRAALGAPAPDYAARAAAALAPWRREAVDALVRDALLPALLP